MSTPAPQTPAYGPLMRSNGTNHFYLNDMGARGGFICKSIGDSVEALRDMKEIERRWNAFPALMEVMDAIASDLENNVGNNGTMASLARAAIAAAQRAEEGA